MIVSHIVAMAKNRIIGNSGDLPWNIPEDLKYFKDTTRNHSIIMGRKTFESIGRPLPKRRNIVITRDKNYSADGIIVTHSIEEALEKASQDTETWGDEVFIAGGGEIYKQSLAKADRLYITEIEKEYSGDASYPEFNSNFKLISKQRNTEPIPYSFCIYEKN